jgi:hypothetical protein
MKPFLTFILLLQYLPLLAQQYNYSHYDTKDGLAGSTVYRMCQDNKGYLWFATDNGVSRFDGKKFTNFTTEDGLTDNEVIFIANDSKGRVWMMPFNKTVCYYNEGKIYSAKNDSLLKRIHFSSFGIMAGENSKGEIYFITHDEIFLYKNSGDFKSIANFKKLGTKYSLKASDFVSANLTGRYPYNSMVLYNQHSVFINKKDSFIYLKNIKSNASQYGNFHKIDEDLEISYPKLKTLRHFNSISHISNTNTLYNTSTGAWSVDDKGNVGLVPFLAGKKISSSLRDAEGSLWFSTIGEGVFKLTSETMKTFGNNQEAFCIENANGRIYSGMANGNLQVIKNITFEGEYPYSIPFEEPISRRLYTLKKGSPGILYLGFDSHLEKISNNKRVFSALRPIKSIDIIDTGNIVVCTNNYTFKLRSSDLKIVDTIWRERGTKVIYDRGSYFIGTLNGLIIIDSFKTVSRIGENLPLLSKRIVDMHKSIDGGLWIATNDNGVLLYKNGRIDNIINKQNELSSNNCKSLFVKDHYLWVGTDKGISKIDIKTRMVLAKYSTADGLPSDIINAVYSNDSITWVCTPEGVTYFKEKDIYGFSMCKLDLYSIYVSGKKMNSMDKLLLSYNNNNISFDYAAISFKGASEMTYKYKLIGLNSDWRETRLTTLAYPSLPSGNYEFQLYAVNKFDTQSDVIKIQFSIAAPFWKTLWFWLGTSSSILILTWYLFNRRYKYLQKITNEKNVIARRMIELEQASLRAQMNPHFIFNCLNSIQHFILKNDIEHTNKYITQFGHLIRQTLNNSVKVNVSITDEINYLRSYLELEKMRFSSGFQYSINIHSKEIYPDYTFIPPMLLQPFVENAIRHGIRHKKEGFGLIKIDIQIVTNRILFSIEDNGIGREASAKYKSKQHIDYHSKGITLTKNRLEILNSESLEKIISEIYDLKGANGNATGTKVVLSFPLSIIEKFN